MSEEHPEQPSHGFVQKFTELAIYKAAFALQQEIFYVSQSWPKTEDYALTNQIRRSSRAVGANIAEAWAKRQYEAHFLSKLTDADAENQETLHWLRTAYACQYVPLDTCEGLADQCKSIGKMLNKMMASSGSFSFPTRRKSSS